MDVAWMGSVIFHWVIIPGTRSVVVRHVKSDMVSAVGDGYLPMLTNESHC